MRIVLLGTGNLATRLGMALHNKHVEIIQVYGRSESGVSYLSGLLGCSNTTYGKEIIKDADLYILAVTEEAIPEVLRAAGISKQLVVHTSGSISMDILSAVSENYGVFYPQQTLSRQKEVDFSTIPICIEANSTENLEKLDRLAHILSDQVYHVDSEKRRHLHLAAVFVCNFVNHLYSIGEKLLQEQQLDFDLLRPLILETANKAMLFSPPEVQTGPAVRDNRQIQEQHLKLLENHPEWQQLYKLISLNIKYLQN
jgi:predicted short-subunit dehydrogenase-like oxidoreductase (DUF2520 family)